MFTTLFDIEFITLISLELLHLAIISVLVGLGLLISKVVLAFTTKSSNTEFCVT